MAVHLNRKGRAVLSQLDGFVFCSAVQEEALHDLSKHRASTRLLDLTYRHVEEFPPLIVQAGAGGPVHLDQPAWPVVRGQLDEEDDVVHPVEDSPEPLLAPAQGVCDLLLCGHVQEQPDGSGLPVVTRPGPGIFKAEAAAVLPDALVPFVHGDTEAPERTCSVVRLNRSRSSG